MESHPSVLGDSLFPKQTRTPFFNPSIQHTQEVLYNVIRMQKPVSDFINYTTYIIRLSQNSPVIL